MTVVVACLGWHDPGPGILCSPLLGGVTRDNQGSSWCHPDHPFIARSWCPLSSAVEALGDVDKQLGQMFSPQLVKGSNLMFPICAAPPAPEIC